MREGASERERSRSAANGHTCGGGTREGRRGRGVSQRRRRRRRVLVDRENNIIFRLQRNDSFLQPNRPKLGLAEMKNRNAVVDSQRSEGFSSAAFRVLSVVGFLFIYLFVFILRAFTSRVFYRLALTVFRNQHLLLRYR